MIGKRSIFRFFRLQKGRYSQAVKPASQLYVQLDTHSYVSEFSRWPKQSLRVCSQPFYDDEKL